MFVYCSFLNFSEGFTNFFPPLTCQTVSQIVEVYLKPDMQG